MSSLLERLRTALASHFEVERELASGGMGTVFLARDPKLDRKVAIKILQPDLASETASERFLREARILAKLSHPNIVPVFQAGDADGLSYYVMEYVEGETLKQRLERGAMPKEQALKLADDLLSALEAAHEHGIVHRDVKPDNIFLLGDRALLGDFGIAKPNEDSRSSLTPSGHRIGTPGYMAPEQLVGDKVTPVADIYAAGMVLYEAFTDRRWSMLGPTEDADWSGVPTEIVPVMQGSLAWSQSDRWPDAPAFRKALAEPAAIPAPLHRRRKSYRAVVLLAALAAMALVTGGLATGVGSGGFSLFAYTGAWASVMAGIWFLFEKAEEVVSPDVRGAAARWLRNLDPAGAVQTWPATFAKVFDRIFSDKHLSWRFFWRSSLASVASVLILGALFASRGYPVLLNPVFWLAVALGNLIPDYVSLLETRLVIRLMGQRPPAIVVAALLATDMIITMSIALVAVVGVLVVLVHRAGDLGVIMLVLFFSAFFTSVWVWLYVLSGLAVRAGGYAGVWLGRFRHVLDIDDQPLRSMGFVAMLLVTFLFLLALPFIAL